MDRFSRQSSRKQSDDLRNLLQTQLYVQQLQHQQPTTQQNQPNRSSDGSEVASLSFDFLARSTSNSDIEEIIDDSLTDLHSIQQITVTQTDGRTTELADDTTVIEAYGHKLKKPLLTGMNLTESSSSGSVTDSICTAYENNTIGTPNKSEQSSTSTISTATITSTIQPTDSNKQTKDSASNESELNKTEDSSAISTMFGGK